MSTTKANERACLMGLPVEIREMILRHLLVASYVATEHDMNSEEYNRDRDYIHKCGDQTYHFSTEIMSTSRQIRKESLSLCRRESDLVCVKYLRRPELVNRLENHGLETIPRDLEACPALKIAMTITIDLGDVDGQPSDMSDISEDDQSWRHVICRDELPAFCRLMLGLQCYNGSLRSAAIHISVSDDIWNGHPAEIDRNLAGLSKIRKLIDPLRQLHSLGAAQVEGPLSSSYKESIVSSLCADPFTTMDIFQGATQSLSQADELVSHNRSVDAIREYKAALNSVRCCSWLQMEDQTPVTNGPFLGLEAGQAMHNLKVRFHARIASLYLKSGQLRMARIYVERALDPWRGSDDRGWKDYDLRIDTWQNAVFAEVLDVSAEIHFRHDNVWKAIDVLGEATTYSGLPLNDDQQRRVEVWQKRADVLMDRYAKKEATKRLQQQRQNEKNEGNFLTACNWKTNGDRLLRSGRCKLAASTYTKALAKTEALDRWQDCNIESGMFAGYDFKDAVHSLRFKLGASLATAQLQCRRYKHLIRRSERTLSCRNDYCYAYREVERTEDRYDYKQHDGSCWNIYWRGERNWIQEHRSDYVKIHNCRALALMHLHDIKGAVEQMKTALAFDPGDGTLFRQLGYLRWRLDRQKRRRRGQWAKEDDTLEEDELPLVGISGKEDPREVDMRWSGFVIGRVEELVSIFSERGYGAIVPEVLSLFLRKR